MESLVIRACCQISLLPLEPALGPAPLTLRGAAPDRDDQCGHGLGRSEAPLILVAGRSHSDHGEEITALRHQLDENLGMERTGWRHRRGRRGTCVSTWRVCGLHRKVSETSVIIVWVRVLGNRVNVVGRSLSVESREVARCVRWWFGDEEQAEASLQA